MKAEILNRNSVLNEKNKLNLAIRFNPTPACIIQRNLEIILVKSGGPLADYNPWNATK